VPDTDSLLEDVDM